MCSILSSGPDECVESHVRIVSRRTEPLRVHRLSGLRRDAVVWNRTVTASGSARQRVSCGTFSTATGTIADASDETSPVQQTRKSQQRATSYARRKRGLLNSGVQVLTKAAIDGSTCALGFRTCLDDLRTGFSLRRSSQESLCGILLLVNQPIQLFCF